MPKKQEPKLVAQLAQTGAFEEAESEKLKEKYGVWGEHPAYPVSDWQYEVGNDDTRLGYWPWVAHRIESEG